MQRIDRLPAKRKLGQIGFPHNDCTRIDQTLNMYIGSVCHKVLKRQAAPGGGLPSHVEIVLDRNRHTKEW